MYLRKFLPVDAQTILSWISNKREFRMWSADRFGDYPITPSDLVAHYDECSSSGTFFPLTAVDENDIVLGHLILRYVNKKRTK